MSVRPMMGAYHRPDAPRARGTHDPLISADAAFERAFHRSQITQTLLDFCAIFAGFLLVTVTGIAISASLFILLFIEVR